MHLRGLVKETGKSVRPVQVAVTELEKAHLLRSEAKGNKKMFSINPNHPLFDSVKQMVADVGSLPGADRKLLQQFFTRHSATHREGPPKTVAGSSRQIAIMLQKAHDELGLANRMADSPATSLKHCHQAAVHAMTAALLARGMTQPRSDKNILRAFHGHYVAPGKIAKEQLEFMKSFAEGAAPPQDPGSRVHKTLEFVLNIREIINTDKDR